MLLGVFDLYSAGRRAPGTLKGEQSCLGASANFSPVALFLLLHSQGWSCCFVCVESGAEESQTQPTCCVERSSDAGACFVVLPKPSTCFLVVFGFFFPPSLSLSQRCFL